MMRATAHRRRRSQRGQAIPIIALSSVVLVGATALAVDLSLNTHARRVVENITDTASLAGAQDLPASPSQSDRQNAAASSLATLDSELGLPVPKRVDLLQTISTGSGNDCTNGGTHCHVVFTAGAYTGTIDIPPVSAGNSSYDTDRYVEVNLAHTNRNNFGQAIGYANSTERGHSVGYHFAANEKLGLALFANTYVGTGNSGELMQGNVYAQRFVNPQSAGQAGFCAGNGGRIVLGAPQLPSSYVAAANPGQADIQPHTANVILQDLFNCNPLHSTTLLNTTTSGTVNQTVADPTNCTDPIPGMTVTAVYSDPAGVGGGVGTCVATPALEAPTNNFQEPTQPTNPPPIQGCGVPQQVSARYSCTAVTGPSKSALVAVSGAFTPGVYVIDHNPSCVAPSCYDIDFNGVTVSAVGVTIVLLNGATMGVEKGANVTIDPTRLCTQTVDTDCRYPVYSGPGSASLLDIRDTGSTLIMYGTLYMVAGTVFCQSNAFLQIPQGQAIVGTWDVQSGNHNNPIITYDAGMVAPETEVLRLAE